METQSFQPTGQQERFRFLDVLRGVALFGILPANIAYQGLPATLDDAAPYALTDSGWREPLAYYLTDFFFNFKFITIFSLLFGVGLALIHERSARRGTPFRRLYLRRIFVLGLFAVGHIVLLWVGDILAFYAAGGLLVMWLARWSAGRLLTCGLVLIMVPAAFLLLTGEALSVMQALPEGRAELAEVDWGLSGLPPPEDGVAAIPPDQRIKYLSPEVETYVLLRGSFAEMASFRIDLWLTALPWVAWLLSWRILGLFLIGMAFVKTRWFTRPEEHLATFRQIGLGGLALGLPLQLVALALNISRAGEWAGMILALGFQYLGSVGISAFYVWLIARAYVAARQSHLFERLAAVGQMALTIYLLQSLLTSLLFCGYGFGLYGRLDRMQLWLVVLGVWAVMLAIGWPWLQRFRFGPLEWLWRVLTYGRWVPLGHPPPDEQP